MIEKRVAVCQSKEEAAHWVELLKRYMPSRSTVNNNNNNKVVPSKAEFVPQPPPHVSIYKFITFVFFWFKFLNGSISVFSRHIAESAWLLYTFIDLKLQLSIR